MASYFKPPSKRRTQGTQVGMPQAGGQKPYAPKPALNQATEPKVQIPQSATTGAVTTRPSWLPPFPKLPQNAHVNALILPTPERQAAYDQATKYFALTSGSNIAEKRLRGGVEAFLGLENLMKERQAGEYEQLRRDYLNKLGVEAGRLTQGQTAAMEQSLRRRGTEFAGYAPAAEQAIRAQAAGKAVETLADFETQLLAAQQAEIGAVRKGMIDFVSMFQQTLYDKTVTQQLAEFQKGLNESSGWDQLMSVVGEVAGSTNVLGKIGGAIGSMFGGGETDKGNIAGG